MTAPVRVNTLDTPVVALTATQAEPLQRQVDNADPPPVFAPVVAASVNRYTDPVVGDAGGEANVVVGGIHAADPALIIPVSILFCFI
jgi:hypothetical protein